jgi:U2-associated protein SR140
MIDMMALYVLDGGCAFEQAVMERGRGNPLFDLKSKEHTYYVWRLYSFAQVLVDDYISIFSIDVSFVF